MLNIIKQKITKTKDEQKQKIGSLNRTNKQKIKKTSK